MGDEQEKLLDEALVYHGFEFNAEETIRDYLSFEDEISETEKDKIVEAVFREWDLRKVTINPWLLTILKSLSSSLRAYGKIQKWTDGLYIMTRVRLI